MVESPTYYSRLFLSWLKDLLKIFVINIDSDVGLCYDPVFNTL